MRKSGVATPVPKRRGDDLDHRSRIAKRHTVSASDSTTLRGLVVTDFYRIERALMFVLEGLCAVCAVFALVAAADADYLWALGFAALSVFSFEAAAELDQ